MSKSLHAAIKSLFRDRSGNVTIITALTLVPVLMSVGMGLDYVSAGQKKSQLNSIADAAALSTVTKAMMSQSSTQAKQSAIAMFTAQAGLINGLTFDPANLSITVTDTTTANTSTRTTTVTYTAASRNSFPNILGRSILTVGGTSSAKSSVVPNVDFYVMLDTSPSMAIAATTAGITTMVNNTSKQGGCAFACHQTNPAADNLGNPGGIDNYQLARNLGVPLRIDLVQSATSNLMDTINQTAQLYDTHYRVALYDFDTAFRTIQPLTSNTTIAKASAANIQLLETYKNSWLTATNNDNDTDTNYDGAMNSINAAMPKPGGGTNNAGDSPQETLFIVTDGVIDENNSGRVISSMGGSWCTTIKNRGIQIAILYTTYNPLPTNSFYNTYVAPFQPNIGTNLQTCASPGLYKAVSTDDDISTALQALFLRVVGSAHLTQ